MSGLVSKNQFLICPLLQFVLILYFYPGYLAGGTESIDKAEDEFIYYLQAAQKNRALGNYEEAMVYFEKALNLAKKIKLKEEILQAVEGKAIVLWNLGKIKEAAECFRQGLLLARDWKLPLQTSFFETCLEVYSLFQEGKTKRQEMDYIGAIMSFERALYLARKIRCPELELKCLRQASLVYFDQNDLENFGALNEKGLRMARLLNHQMEEGRFLNNIGLYYLKKGNLLRSFSIFNKASFLIETKGTKQDLADCLYNLGTTILEMGFYDRAIKYFKKVMEIDKETGNVDAYILDLNNIGLCLLNKGKVNNDLLTVKESLDYFREALRFSEEHRLIKRKITVLNNLGNAIYFLGEEDKAKSLLTDALVYSNTINDKYHLIAVNDSLGSLYIDSKPKMALKYLFEALKFTIGSNFYVDKWAIYYNIGRCYEKLNQLELAIEYYSKAINLIDEIRKQINYDFYQVGFLRNKQDAFDALIRVKKKIYDRHNEISHKRDLFETIERTRAKSFLQVINNSQINDKSTSNDSGIYRDYSQDKDKDMSELWSKINNLGIGGKSQFDNIRKEDLYLTWLAEKINKQMNIKKEVHMPDLQELQGSILNKKTAILEYYLGDWGSLGIVITKDNFEIIDLPAKTDLENSIIGYTKWISRPPLKNITGQSAAKRIYKEIFEPMEKWLSPEIENIIIIPDGFLYSLPFESLIKENGNKSNYLVEKFNIAYAPSMSSIIALSIKKNEFGDEDKDILAIGYPQYNFFYKEKGKQKKNGMDSGDISANVPFSTNLQLSDLPYTKKEIKAIRSMFARNEREIYTGKAASEDLIKNLPLDKYKIIHFACHSYLDESFPFRSALILSPNPERGQDGFLQAYEISHLRLKARLVVLSTCQSAWGPLERAEGVLSLNRVFFMCGAEAVISSLWQVNDRSSAVLMSYFYRYLRKGISIAEALRKAKLEMLASQFGHPFYWAGFILNGEGFSVIFDRK